MKGKVHFIAIGGSVMHNLAITLKQLGYEVSGSDDKIYDPSRSRLEKYNLLPKDLGWFPELIDKEIDLYIYDDHQLKYHRNNVIVKKCLDVINERRLDKAGNRPRSLYVSLTDFTHKNRLVIPFFNNENKIVFYQSRTILPEDDDKSDKE